MFRLNFTYFLENPVLNASKRRFTLCQCDNHWLHLFLLQTVARTSTLNTEFCTYEGISKSFEPNMERARNLDLFCFIFQRSPLPTPHTCPI